MVATSVEGDVYRAHLDTLNRYCHALDTCDWGLFTSLFTEDIVFTARAKQEDGEWGPVELRLEERASLVAHLTAIWENLSATHHMISNQHVEPAPDGRSAKGSCYIRAYHGGAGERRDLFEESLGRFDFETVRQGSEWKIRRWDENIMIILGTTEVFGHGA